MNNVIFSPYEYSSKEMFTEHKGVFLIPVGTRNSKYYPVDFKDFQSNVYGLYQQAINSNETLGHGIIWSADAVKVILALCIDKKNKPNSLEYLDFNVLNTTIFHITEITTAPIFIYWGFVSSFVDYEWFENFLERLEVKQQTTFYITVGKDNFNDIKLRHDDYYKWLQNYENLMESK